MFGKKPSKGTEDQAYDLMNLGGFGGLKRKSEAPQAAAPIQPQAQKKYALHAEYDAQAKNLVTFFKMLAQFTINETRKAANGEVDTPVEAVFKHVCYRELIRAHLQNCLFLQYPLMESVLYQCEQLNRPELHLVELVTLAHWRPLLSLAYQELYVPILMGKIDYLMAQRDALATFQGKHRFGYGTVRHDLVRTMSDEEIMVNFLKTIPVFQAPFLMMPYTLESEELSPLITHGKDFFDYIPAYQKTWVTTTLKCAFDTAKDTGKSGRGIGLDQFPNQGPNFALLMLLFFHQINMDYDPAKGKQAQRYRAETIPDVESVKENFMSAMAGSKIFESLVPDIKL